MLQIGIVGAGFSGVSCFINIIDILLSDRIKEKIKITFFDKALITGRGLAYSTLNSTHLLNTPSDTAGILYNRKDGFKKWLLSRYREDLSIDSDIIDLQHPPRKVYGQYIEEMFELYVRKAQSLGINIDKKYEEVTGIYKYSSQYLIHTEKSSDLIFDYIILAIGGFESRKFDAFKNCACYVKSPYDAEFNYKIDKMNDVLIAGTRLSCIDAILALQDNGHQGKIMCVSGSGSLPRVIDKYNTKEKLFITNEFIDKPEMVTLNDIFNAIEKEFFFQEKIMLNIRKVLKVDLDQEKILRHEIMKTKNGRAWQDALYDTDNMLNKAWYKLDMKSKKKIVQRYLKFFLIYRAAMPRRSACRLLQLFKEDRLFIYRKPVKFSFVDGFFEVKLSDGTILIARNLIDATGISYGLSLSDSDLVKSIVDNELFTLNQWGGLAVSTETYQSHMKNGASSRGLFVLGGAVLGTDLITNLIVYLVNCSFKIASTIITDIKERR